MLVWLAAAVRYSRYCCPLNNANDSSVLTLMCCSLVTSGPNNLAGTLHWTPSVLQWGMRTPCSTMFPSSFQTGCQSVQLFYAHIWCLLDRWMLDSQHLVSSRGSNNEQQWNKCMYVEFFRNQSRKAVSYSVTGWLGGRVVSVPDSGSEEHRFESVATLSSSSLRQTVHTHCA